YSEFAKTLRTWFVAYGIGAPALLVTTGDLWERLVQAHGARRVMALFLVGVGAQVVQAFTYKTCMWYLYLAELKPKLIETRRHRACVTISETFGIELLFDFATLGAFALATWILFRDLAG